MNYFKALLFVIFTILFYLPTIIISIFAGICNNSNVEKDIYKCQDLVGGCFVVAIFQFICYMATISHMNGENWSDDESNESNDVVI
jgi:hypothetical protein